MSTDTAVSYAKMQQTVQICD